MAKYQVINGKPKTLPASEGLHAKLCFLATVYDQSLRETLERLVDKELKRLGYEPEVVVNELEIERLVERICKGEELPQTPLTKEALKRAVRRCKQ
ncbi:hypothetical protein IPA_02765 [Ignicoccus pacificus DSM 13166]|uniref:Uncharacterized protein n=1 Tax=Ignicoccus pacificus DSM 13166 TaxID=940294 RepID=A0A977PJY0_9CREN|nr:hypothetical protein IPA_02765 [Ignicoccus pacificus DSM 13166]